MTVLKLPGRMVALFQLLARADLHRVARGRGGGPLRLARALAMDEVGDCQPSVDVQFLHERIENYRHDFI